MTLKPDKYHRDYLFWIYPLIILGLTIFAIKRDTSHKKSDQPSKTETKSALTPGSQSNVVDNITTQTNYDSIPIFYPAEK
jgi:cytochrome c-type biogenesis protein CcmH/NrfF